MYGLIECYSSKAQDFDKEVQQQHRRATVTTPTLTPMNQSSGISFTDLLTKIKTHYEKERDLTTSPPSIASTLNNMKTIQSNKVKGTTSAASNSSTSALTNKAPVGTTLAKLLSSNNNGNSLGGRSLEESSIFNHNKSASNNSAGSEKNLSLANLLASSKVYK